MLKGGCKKHEHPQQTEYRTTRAARWCKGYFARTRGQACCGIENPTTGNTALPSHINWHLISSSFALHILACRDIITWRNFQRGPLLHVTYDFHGVSLTTVSV